MLKEFEERDRAGGFIDRRFGENDPTMTPEERMLERFTRERQRTSKGVAFNLEDEDELTHYGQSLSKLDDFDNVGLGLDDDEEEGGLSRTLAGSIQANGIISLQANWISGLSRGRISVDLGMRTKTKTRARMARYVPVVPRASMSSHGFISLRGRNPRLKSWRKSSPRANSIK